MRRFSPNRLSSALLATVLAAFRSRAALQVETLALRHQIGVLQRSVKRPKLIAADGFLWAWLSRLWADWRAVLVILEAGDGDRLTPQGLPAVLEVEGPLGTARAATRWSGCSSSTQFLGWSLVSVNGSRR